VALVVIAFAPGLVAFTVHYLALRGFYALEDTRTPFLVQIAVAVTLVANAVLVRTVYDVRYTAAGLGLGWSVAYVVGAGTSLTVLGRRIGRLGQLRLIGHVVRLALASLPAAAVAGGVVLALGRTLEGGDVLTSAVQAAAGGLAAVLTFLLTTRLVRVREIDDAVSALLRRVRPDRSRSDQPPTMGPSDGQRPGDDAGDDPAARATTGGS
jgi:putative peptidoglycan lipid II flippase